MLYREHQVYLQDYWTPKSYCKRYRKKLKLCYRYKKSSSTVIQSPQGGPFILLTDDKVVVLLDDWTLESLL